MCHFVESQLRECNSVEDAFALHNYFRFQRDFALGYYDGVSDEDWTELKEGYEGSYQE